MRRQRRRLQAIAFSSSSLLLCGLMLAAPAHAQFRAIEPVKREATQSAQETIGRIFWTSPTGESISAVTFYDGYGPDSSKFEVTEDTRFRVDEVIEANSLTWLLVRFIDSPDDRIGYVTLDQFRRLSKAPETPFFHWSITQYNISPNGPPASEIKALRANSRSQEQAAAAEIQAELSRVLAARQSNPPRIGMTAAQAADSSWGPPSDVNRTTVRGLTREQWIYPWGYVYVENGYVTAVQD